METEAEGDGGPETPPVSFPLELKQEGSRVGSSRKSVRTFFARVIGQSQGSIRPPQGEMAGGALMKFEGCTAPKESTCLPALARPPLPSLEGTLPLCLRRRRRYSPGNCRLGALTQSPGRGFSPPPQPGPSQQTRLTEEEEENPPLSDLPLVPPRLAIAPLCFIEAAPGWGVAPIDEGPGGPGVRSQSL